MVFVGHVHIRIVLKLTIKHSRHEERVVTHAKEICGYAKVDEIMEYTEEQVLRAIYESGLHQYAPGVIRTTWKEGIDIAEPRSCLMNFVRKLTVSA